MKRFFQPALCLALVACDGVTSPKEHIVPDLPNVQANLAFTCIHEDNVIPERDPEADQLYIHARWLKKGNLLKKEPLVYPKIERLIRISTAYGHDKANLELRQMIGKGTAKSTDIVKETLDLTQDLIDRGIPGGFYDMGRYLEIGYGVKQDQDLALKYYRKSADLGSPEGQFVVGEKLDAVDVAMEIGRKMLKCAVEQGHGKAGLSLGIGFQIFKLYPEALQAFQLGAKAGDPIAALAMEKGFNGPSLTNEAEYLGQQKDEERVRRYEAIGHLLSAYSYLNPKVPEIDQIVPLPPAKLPEWDGSFQWLKTHEANVPPPMPTEERIREMAAAKGLDPETGRPLPSKHAEAPAPEPVKVAAPSIPLGTVLPSGTRCPQSGFWQCAVAHALGGERRFVTAGETLPSVLVPVERSWVQKLKGAPQNELAETAWTLVAYPGGEGNVVA